MHQVGALSVRLSKLQPQVNLTQNSQDLSEQMSSTISNNLCNNIMDAIMVLNNADAASTDPPEPQANATSTADSVQQLTKLVSDLQQ